MAVLVWDDLNDRLYESGLDRGVLYRSDGTAVPWTGLVSVKVDKEQRVESLYFGGVKYCDLTNQEELSATVASFTWPNELDARGLVVAGSNIKDQPPERFNLSYRQKMSDGTYRIHVMGNLVFSMSGVTYDTLADKPRLSLFEWAATSPRVGAATELPTSHMIIETGSADAGFLEFVESILYGSASVDASLPSFEIFVGQIIYWVRFLIFDEGDGRWTASSFFPEYIFDEGGGKFRIENANATYLDADTYQIEDIPY